jgi:hypothetical protein
LGSDTLPCRPFSAGKQPDRGSRYMLIIGDIIYDITFII